MRRRSKAGSAEPRRRKSAAAKCPSKFEATRRGATSSAPKEEGEGKKADLRENEQKLRQIIETVPGRFWSMDPDGEPTHINQRFLDYFGIRRLEDIKHGGWEPWVHPDDTQFRPEVRSRLCTVYVGRTASFVGTTLPVSRCATDRGASSNGTAFL